MNFLNQSKITIPILLASLFLFSFLLYKNITRSVREGVNPPIGVLTFKNRKIQRKFDGEVVWETIPTETLIRNRDTIRTENLSDAVLTLEDGTEIDIGQNSMILVDFSDKRFNLNFAYGTVGAKKGSGDTNLMIQAGDSAVSVESGELSLNKLGENLDVNVANGQAKLKVGEEEKSLEKNQTANISAEGVNVKTQSIILTNPRDRGILQSENKLANVNFQWRSNSEASKNEKILVATDLGFRRIAASSTVSSGSYSKQMSPGSYYWKIQYLDSSGNPTETNVQRFSIIENSSISLYTPANNSSISINPDISNPISFSWGSVDSVSRYRIEVSSDTEFNTIIESKETKSSSIGIMGLKEGRYFFRVKGISSLPDIRDTISETRSFQLVASTSLDPPSLVEPQDKKIINTISIPENGILLSCRDRIEFSEYVFQISKDNTFSSMINSIESKNNFARWNPGEETGVFYWRVVAGTASGSNYTSKANSFSISEKVELSPQRPIQASKLEYPQDGKIFFSWKPIPNIGKAKLILSKDSDFNSVINETGISGSGISISISGAGSFFWKLAWEGNGQKVESGVQNFSIIIPIENPRITSPRPGSQVDMTQRDDLLLQWTEVKNSSSYIVRLLDVTGLREREILNTKIQSTSFRFRDLTRLNQGKFRLEVRATGLSPGGTTIESKTDRSDFFISLQSGLSTKILSPRRIYVE